MRTWNDLRWPCDNIRWMLFAIKALLTFLRSVFVREEEFINAVQTSNSSPSTFSTDPLTLVNNNENTCYYYRQYHLPLKTPSPVCSPSLWSLSTTPGFP